MMVLFAASHAMSACARHSGVSGSRTAGREALLRYVLRPPIAQERVTQGPEGLVRITLKKPFRDGTVAVDMDPLSLLCRLAACAAIQHRPLCRRARRARKAALTHRAQPTRGPLEDHTVAPAHADSDAPRAPSRYRPWAELLKRTFSVDVLECESCHGRLKLLAMVTHAASIARFLRKLGEPTQPPPRLPARGPPY
jgi:hypothetical protein